MYFTVFLELILNTHHCKKRFLLPLVHLLSPKPVNLTDTNNCMEFPSFESCKKWPGSEHHITHLFHTLEHWWVVLIMIKSIRKPLTTGFEPWTFNLVSKHSTTAPQRIRTQFRILVDVKVIFACASKALNDLNLNRSIFLTYQLISARAHN